MKKNKRTLSSLFIRKEGHLTLFFFGTQCLLFVAVLCLLSIQYVRTTELAKRVEKERQILDKVVRAQLTPPAIYGKSFIIYDLSTEKVVAGKDEYSKKPLASLTKLRTAYIFAQRNDINTQVTIPSLSKGHVYDFALKPRDTWNVSDLMKYMLTISSNDAAEILSSLDKEGRSSFLTAMNTWNASTSAPLFTTPSGLDIGEEVGGYGSSYDVALMMKDLYETNPEILEATTKNTLTVSINNQKRTGIPNTNQDVTSYPGVLGSKTGFTDKAGGNLAVIFDNSYGKPLIGVILGSTKEGRFEDMKKLIDFSMQNRELLYLNEK